MLVDVVHRIMQPLMEVKKHCIQIASDFELDHDAETHKGGIYSVYTCIIQQAIENRHYAI